MGTLETSAGDLVRARRSQLGLSQRAAAGVCGVPQSMLSRIESGETQPSIATVRKILEHLGAQLHLELHSPTAHEGRREKQRSLWLNRAVVGELTLDPERTMAIARDNIERWRIVHASSPSILAALDVWSWLLDEGVEALAATLTGCSEEAADLRQNSPFAGVLTPEQRDRILTSFRTHWESRHRPSSGELVAPRSTPSR